MEFVDEHGTEVLNLGSFTLLPQHVVRLILCREELKADEFTKFQVSECVNESVYLKLVKVYICSSLLSLICQAALMWGKKYCDNNPEIHLKDVICMNELYS